MALLAGYSILCTAVREREREEVARLVEQLGGSLCGVSLRDPPHVVITRNVRSPKYRALLRAHPHLPVVTPDWLAASAQVRPALAWVLRSRRRCPAALL